MSWKPPTRSCSIPHNACQAAYSPYSKFNGLRPAFRSHCGGQQPGNAAYPGGKSRARCLLLLVQHPDDPIVAAAVVTDSTMSVLISRRVAVVDVMLETISPDA